jgi:hypothetical protein
MKAQKKKGRTHNIDGVNKYREKNPYFINKNKCKEGAIGNKETGQDMLDRKMNKDKTTVRVGVVLVMVLMVIGLIVILCLMFA